MGIKAIDDQYLANTYKRFPIEIVSGKGSMVQDSEGKAYIDMGSGIAVTAFGVADDAWIEAVTEQIHKVQHTSNLYYSEPCALLAQALCERTGMAKVFFSNSGAEANECAIKVARKYAAEHKGSDYYTIVTLENSFHGRTLTTLAATGQTAFHQLFTPLTPGFAYTKANDIDHLRQLAESTKIAAVMIECVQGEGGVLPLTPAYAQALSEFVKEQDVLLIVDEVQTGNGRCGALYAYMNLGLEPDIVSTAKGLAGGLPLGATLMNAKVGHVLSPGDHGSTFGGNPVASAAALSNLKRIDEALLTEVKAKSDYIFNTLRGASGIESVDGMGLMIGIKTVKPADEVIAQCMEQGVLCLKAKDKVRLLPALNIPMDLLRKAVEVIQNAAKVEE